MSANPNVRIVLTYGSSRRWGLLSVLVGIALCAVGVWMVVEAAKVSETLTGIAVGLIGVPVTLSGIGGMRSPDGPTLMLSPAGIRCTDVSEKTIPWSVIVAIDTRSETRPGELVSWRCVTSIAVSKPFYDTLGSLMPHAAAPAVWLYEFINIPRKYAEAVEVEGEPSPDPPIEETGIICGPNPPRIEIDDGIEQPE